MKLSDIKSLSGPTVENCKKALLNLISNGTSQQKARDLPFIAKLKPHIIYALSQTPEINSFFESDSFLNEQWKTQLNTNQYHGKPIVSFDKKINISIFEQFKGAFLWNEFNSYEDKKSFNALEILNEACNLGMYDALIYRMKMKIDLIKKETDPEKVEYAISLIVKDANTLSNIYWSVGSINAAILLFHIIKIYFQTERSKIAVERFFGPLKTFTWQSYDSKLRPYPIIVLEQAMEYLYLAKLTADFPQSKAITRSYNLEDDPLSRLQDELRDPAKFESIIIGLLKDLQVPLIASFCDKASEQATRILCDNYPDVKYKLK